MKRLESGRRKKHVVLGWTTKKARRANETALQFVSLLYVMVSLLHGTPATLMSLLHGTLQH